ncbi:MAG: hypothetical protein JJE55_08070 [Flavobacteriaceae bacterium]|nr:hypothetical protein [Flavobacteriaceae bacterium]
MTTQAIRNFNEVITRLRSAVIAKDTDRINSAIARAKDLPWHLINDEQLEADFQELETQAKSILNPNK